LSYNDDFINSHSKLQADIKSGVDAKAAAISHFQRLLTASRTWNVHNASFQALCALGQSPTGTNADT